MKISIKDNCGNKIDFHVRTESFATSVKARTIIEGLIALSIESGHKVMIKDDDTNQ